jgi:hypothetical protein
MEFFSAIDIVLNYISSLQKQRSRCGKNFHFSTLSIPALETTQPLFNAYGGSLPGSKEDGA